MAYLQIKSMILISVKKIYIYKTCHYMLPLEWQHHKYPTFKTNKLTVLKAAGQREQKAISGLPSSEFELF